MASEKPTSTGSGIDLQNQSTSTAITDKDNDENGTNTSPPTSPLYFRIDNKETPDYNEKFSDAVLSRSVELISIMKQISDNMKLEDHVLKSLEENYQAKPEHFDWKSIIESSENIFNDYSKQMEQVTKEFEDISRVHSLPLII